MERRVTSHTEEEEMNQRRKLLGLARKGDQKAISKLFELYQVKIYTGESLKKVKLPAIKLVQQALKGEGKRDKPTAKGKKTIKKKLKISKKPKKPKKPKKSPKGVKPRGAGRTPKKPVSRSLKIHKTGKKVTKTHRTKTKAKPKAKQKIHARPRRKPKAKKK